MAVNVSAMVPIYGNLIVKGKKRIYDVPADIRDAVSDWLIEKGHPELSDEIL